MSADQNFQRQSQRHVATYVVCHLLVSLGLQKQPNAVGATIRCGENQRRVAELHVCIEET